MVCTVRAQCAHCVFPTFAPCKHGAIIFSHPTSTHGGPSSGHGRYPNRCMVISAKIGRSGYPACTDHASMVRVTMHAACMHAPVSLAFPATVRHVHGPSRGFLRAFQPCLSTLEPCPTSPYGHHPWPYARWEPPPYYICRASPLFPPL